MAQNNEQLRDKIATRGNSTPAITFESEFRGWLKTGGSKQLQSLLGGEAAARRFIVMAMDTMNGNPDLFKCSAASLINSFTRAATCNLYPGKGMQEAAIVPFGNEAQFIPMYQGLVQLAYRSGMVRAVWAEVVRENDIFDYAEGTSRFITHKKKEGGIEVRGARRCVYACYTSNFGNTEFAIMWPDEIASIKKRAPGANSKYSPWNGDDNGAPTNTDGMWRKSAVRQLSKFMPKSIEFQRAMMFDDEVESGNKQVTIVDADKLLGAVFGPTHTPELPQTEPAQTDQAPPLAQAAAQRVSQSTIPGSSSLPKDC